MTSPVVISELQADYQATERSTAQTVKEMGRHIRECANDPLIRKCALDAVADGVEAPGSRREVAAAVWRWLKRNIKFVPDEDQIRDLLGRGDELELLISPSVMVRPDLLERARGYRQMQGDCDCFVMTGNTMLAALGIPPLIETIKCDRQEPWRWSHVCGGAVLENKTVMPIDASHGDFPGWHVPLRDVYAVQYWDIDGNRMGGPMYTSRGMSGYRKLKSWTGDPMTTLSGPAIDPYPQLDVMWYWHPILGQVSPAQRKRGLGALARGRFTRGLGAQVCDDTGCYDDGTGPSTDPFSTIPVGGTNVGTDATVQTSPYTPPPLGGGSGGGSSASSGGGFNWNNLISNLFGAGTKLGSQALLTPGTVMLPNGTIVAGTPQGTSNVTLGGISTGTLLIGALVIGGVLLLSGKR